MRKTQLNRRELLQAGCAAAAGLAAPYVITSAALGAENKAPASERITVGHIGVGGRGRDLFRGIQAVPDAQSVAVADCYRDRRESMAAICQGKAYQDFRELLARDDIDAVVVATPDHWHVPIAILAAHPGKALMLRSRWDCPWHRTWPAKRPLPRPGPCFNTARSSEYGPLSSRMRDGAARCDR